VSAEIVQEDARAGRRVFEIDVEHFSWLWSWVVPGVYWQAEKRRAGGDAES